ncbi:MAG: hypothetical protein ACK5BN_20275, partial [Planctomycetota bacterium]
MSNDLVQLARSLQFDALDTAWGQAVREPDGKEAARYATVIDILCDRDMASRALGMATAMIGALAGRNETQAAIEFGFRVMRKSAHNDALAKTIAGLIDTRWGDENWLPVLKTRAGLDAAASVGSLVEFDRLRRYTRGHVVYHAAGWGEGAIEDFDATTQDVTVQFATGRREAFPLDTLLSRFKALDEQDLRAMKLQRMDALRAEAEKQPALLLRRAAVLYRGTIGSQEIKKELCPSVV